MTGDSRHAYLLLSMDGWQNWREALATPTRNFQPPDTCGQRVGSGLALPQMGLCLFSQSPPALSACGQACLSRHNSVSYRNQVLEERILSFRFPIRCFQKCQTRHHR